jgi:hypothetical protein
MVRMYRHSHSRKPPLPSLLGTTILMMPKTKDARDHEERNRLFQLLLGAELVGVSALALSAVGRTGRETSVALAADHLVAVELGGESLERGLNETAAETEDQVESRLLLNIVVRESAAILELLASEDQALLVRGDALLVLDLGLDIVNRVRGLDLEGDGLAREGLDEDLHTATQTKDEVESRLLLDIVVGKGAAVFELLAGEDESLLVRGNAFLVLNLLLHVLDGVRALNLEGDGLSSQSLDENLHSSSQSEDKMEGAFLLNIVIGQGSSIFQLLAGEDESLLIWGDSLLFFDLFLDIVDCIGAQDLKGNCLYNKNI